MKFKYLRERGVTLLEIMLVLVVTGILITLSINYIQRRAEQLRIERAAMQMQQVLNAGLAFYVGNGRWPDSIAELQQNNFLGQYGVKMVNPWGGDFTIFTGRPPMMYVMTRIDTPGIKNYAGPISNVLAGLLPFGYTTENEPQGNNPPTMFTCGGPTERCKVVTSINIPGQNLNNASAVNFAGVYNNGGCIPVPQCPQVAGKETKPQVIVVPTSVSGIVEPKSGNDPLRALPITSFTGYIAKTAGNRDRGTTNNPPPNCHNPDTTVGSPCLGVGNVPANQEYWRACLQIITERGVVSEINPNWGGDVKLVALTRCEIVGEPAGSPISLWYR